MRKSVKYNWILKEVESKSIKIEGFTIFIGWKNSDKLQKSEQAQTKHQIGEVNSNQVENGEFVFVSAERLEEKDTLGRFFKSTTKVRSFFNKEEIFVITKRINYSDDTYYYQVKRKDSENTLKVRFLSKELFTINDQYI